MKNEIHFSFVFNFHTSNLEDVMSRNDHNCVIKISKSLLKGDILEEIVFGIFLFSLLLFSISIIYNSNEEECSPKVIHSTYML